MLSKYSWRYFSSILLIGLLFWAVGIQCCQTPLGLKTSISQQSMACHKPNPEPDAPCRCHLSPAHLAQADFDGVDLSPLSALYQAQPFLQMAHTKNAVKNTALRSKNRTQRQEKPPDFSLRATDTIVLLI